MNGAASRDIWPSGVWGGKDYANMFLIFLLTFQTAFSSCFCLSICNWSCKVCAFPWLLSVQHSDLNHEIRIKEHFKFRMNSYQTQNRRSLKSITYQPKCVSRSVKNIRMFNNSDFLMNTKPWEIGEVAHDDLTSCQSTPI